MITIHKYGSECLKLGDIQNKFLKQLTDSNNCWVNIINTVSHEYWFNIFFFSVFKRQISNIRNEHIKSTPQ